MVHPVFCALSFGRVVGCVLFGYTSIRHKMREHQFWQVARINSDFIMWLGCLDSQILGLKSQINTICCNLSTMLTRITLIFSNFAINFGFGTKISKMQFVDFSLGMCFSSRCSECTASTESVEMVTIYYIRSKWHNKIPGQTREKEWPTTLTTIWKKGSKARCG